MIVMAAVVKGAEEAGEWAYQRSLAAMRRQWAVYDHEKVFWNSVWTVGLIGLGWVAVQLGKTIEAVMSLPEQIANQLGIDVPGIGDPRYEYLMITNYVEGDGKKKSVPAPKTGGLGLGIGGAVPNEMYDDIMLYRSDANAYASWKQEFKVAHPELKDYINKIDEVHGTSVAFTSRNVLHKLDQFYGEYGPVMPFAAVMGHMGLESLRVYRIRKRLK